ncbi:MAG: protein translocase subunit SecD, partial [Betaproteobacteria bacterium]|nr:protein translocase subunit SecD [Betaproteobacteria bacterium]
MEAALSKRYDAMVSESRTLLRDKRIRHSGISRGPDLIEVRFKEEALRAEGLKVLGDQFPEVVWQAAASGNADAPLSLRGILKPDARKRIQDVALKQNILTLGNRINELGVAEPIVQQQGADRIVVQLPGVQ